MEWPRAYSPPPVIRPDAAAVRAARLNQHLTIEELAARARLGLRTIWRIERGHADTVRERTMFRLANALDKPVSELTLELDDATSESERREAV